MFGPKQPSSAWRISTQGPKETSSILSGQLLSRTTFEPANPHTQVHSVTDTSTCPVVLPRVIFYTRPTASLHCILSCSLPTIALTLHIASPARPFNKHIISTAIWNLTLYFICECRRHFSALSSFELYAISITGNSTQHAEQYRLEIIPNSTCPGLRISRDPACIRS